MTTDTEQLQQTATAAKPSAAADNLQCMIEEEAARGSDDDALATEIGDDEAAQLNARRDVAARQKAADAGASMAIGFVDQILRMVDPAAPFIPEEKDALHGALVPVLLQGGNEPPQWVVDNKPYIDLFMVGVGVSMGVWVRTKAARAEREVVVTGTAAAE